MILRALYDLALRKNLIEDPDFTDLRIDFEISLADDGRVLTIVPLGDDGKGARMPVPRVPKRTMNVAAGFLVDNAKYVLGVDPKDSERAGRCLAAFRERIKAVADATADAGTLAVLRFLDRLPEQLPVIFRLRPREEWTGSENIIFRRDADDSLVHQRDEVRAYYAAARQSEEQGSPQQCLVTGMFAPPARLHPSIKRIPKASTAGGVAMVSFNAAAFETHGLDQGQNAPISRAAAEGYATALNWLLAPEGQRRFRQGIQVGDDAVIVFWTKDSSDIPAAILAEFDPTDASPRELLQAPWRGQNVAIKDDVFYAITLSASGARLVVRDWFRMALKDLVAKIRLYFNQISLGPEDGRPRSLRPLLQALEGPAKDLPPDLATRLFTAILSGRPFPEVILSAAVRRMRVPDDAGPWLLRARCGLIKAALLRNDKYKEVPVSLDEDNPNQAYLLGRLFAVLERMQGEAQGDINATIRDRFYGAASATPALVFPRLLRLSVHHAAKLESPYRERQKGEIVARLTTFPQRLSLPEQGQFAIGYYQQRETFFTKKPTTNQHQAATEQAGGEDHGRA